MDEKLQKAKEKVLDEIYKRTNSEEILTLTRAFNNLCESENRIAQTLELGDIRKVMLEKPPFEILKQQSSDR